jgi:hypothetical protein
MLSDAEVHRFIENGFVRIDGAFPREIADAGRPALWQAVGCDPHDRGTWTRPVVRIGPINDRDGTQPLSFRPPPIPPSCTTRSTSWSGAGDGSLVRMSACSSCASLRPPTPDGMSTSAFQARPAIPRDATTRDGASISRRRAARYSCCFYSPTLAKTTHPRASGNWLTSARNGTWLSQLAKQERCTCVILSSSTLRRSTKALRRAL